MPSTKKPTKIEADIEMEAISMRELVDTPKESVGGRLKQAREAAGFTQDEAAPYIKKTRPVISHMETNQRNPTMDELLIFSELYNVSIVWLMTGAVGDAEEET